MASALRDCSGSSPIRRLNARSIPLPGGSSVGSGSLPRRCASVSARGSSRSASGLPAARFTSASATSSVTLPTSSWITRARRVVGEAPEGQRRQAGGVDPARLVEPRGDDEDEALRAQAPRGEQHRAQRLVVEPVRVVDHGEHRLVLGRRREQAEDAGGDGEGVVRRRRLERERRAERLGLDLGDPVAQVQDRAEQRVQARVGQVALGLVAAGAQDEEPVGGGDRVLEQRRLADPRLAGDEQRAARALARAVEELREPG